MITNLNTFETLKDPSNTCKKPQTDGIASETAESATAATSTYATSNVTFQSLPERGEDEEECSIFRIWAPFVQDCLRPNCKDRRRRGLFTPRQCGFLALGDVNYGPELEDGQNNLTDSFPSKPHLDSFSRCDTPRTTRSEVSDSPDPSSIHCTPPSASRWFSSRETRTKSLSDEYYISSLSSSSCKSRADSAPSIPCGYPSPSGTCINHDTVSRISWSNHELSPSTPLNKHRRIRSGCRALSQSNHETLNMPIAKSSTSSSSPSSSSSSPSRQPTHPQEIEAQSHLQTAIHYENDGCDKESMSHYLRALSIIRKCPTRYEASTVHITTQILHRMGVMQWKCGQYDNALQYLTLCAHVYQESSNGSATTKGEEGTEEHFYEEMAETYHQIGSVYLSLGQFKDAKKSLYSSLRLRKCQLGMGDNSEAKMNQDPNVARTLMSLGSVFEQQGQYHKAMKHFQRVLRTQKRALGENSIHLAHTLNNIGALYEKSGQYREAMTVYSEALWLYRVAVGHDHFDVAVTFNNIGQVHFAWNEYGEAMEAYEEALRIFTNIVGSRHRNVATILHNLALVHSARGRYENALELYEEALSIQREALGDMHLDVATTMFSMAQMYECAGNCDQALKIYRWALKIQTSVMGKKHIFVAFTLHQIANLYHEKGRLADSIKYCTQVLQIYNHWGLPNIHIRVKHISDLMKQILVTNHVPRT